MTTRIITFLVGDPYKPSFPTVTGRGPYPNDRYGPTASVPPTHPFEKTRWTNAHLMMRSGISQHAVAERSEPRSAKNLRTELESYGFFGGEGLLMEEILHQLIW